jgi:uncharacterized protein YjbI with pentapeptide repeats
MPEDVRITVGLAVLAALLLAIAVWWLWWRLPKREVARLSLKIRDPKARADVKDNFRKTVGQALGGIAVLLGAGLAYLQFSQQQRASHDLLISNQISKGFEQLGSEKVVVRLGGIYALEGAMNNSDQYRRPVLDALTAFVRASSKDNTSTPADIQAALIVIVSANANPVDLRGANLSGANLYGANLAPALLTEANLTGANLGDANLTQAELTRANLTGARLTGANLGDANLKQANLTQADLSAANLGDAHLHDANLTQADLTYANLTNALLAGANLTHANLTHANLYVASLAGANLTNANLTNADLDLDDQKQLDEACGSDAVLPRGLTLKPCPSQSSP